MEWLRSHIRSSSVYVLLVCNSFTQECLIIRSPSPFSADLQFLLRKLINLLLNVNTPLTSAEAAKTCLGVRVHWRCPPPSRCSPGAVEERHPRGATPGHGRRMEPEGGGALAVRASLEAIITATVAGKISRKEKQNKTKTAEYQQNKHWQDWLTAGEYSESNFNPSSPPLSRAPPFWVFTLRCRVSWFLWRQRARVKWTG